MVEHNDSNAALTAAVAAMARGIGSEPLVEGVERPEQRDRLFEQGYRMM